MSIPFKSDYSSVAKELIPSLWMGFYHLFGKICLLIVFLLLGATFQPAKAQYIPGKLSKDATISILTVGPAQPAYTAFGHTAIRLQDPRYQIDIVFNYGTFDFDAPGFFWKFFYGDLDYFLSVQDFAQFKQSNTDLGRSIVSQSLDLPHSKINTVVKNLEQNALPENRSYQYRFFSRNCVTQVRDLLPNQISGSSFQQVGDATLSGSTYRQKLDSYLSGRPWMQLGINLMLGAGADKPLSKHEQNFLPNTLHLSLARATDASGRQFVKSSKTITQAVIKESKPAVPPFVVFWSVFLIVTALTATSLLQGWQGLWIDRILFGGVGLLGVIIALGAFVSLHDPLKRNWNLLWALPTHLLVAAIPQVFSQNKGLCLYFWGTLVLNIVVVAAWSVIPQQLPPAVIPIAGSLIIRSAFRLYMHVPQRSLAKRNTATSNHLSSQESNVQPVKIP